MLVGHGGGAPDPKLGAGLEEKSWKVDRVCELLGGGGEDEVGVSGGQSQKGTEGKPMHVPRP